MAVTADCPFCAIAADPASVALVYDDGDLIAFLDHMPIREGHLMIMPRAHYPYFDDMPQALAASAMALAQRLARMLKRLYRVERVAFFATGSDVPHAHLHLFPMREKSDLTSARYMAAPPIFRGIPIAPKSKLETVADRLRATLEESG